MGELTLEELHARSRVLFIDLLKLILSLSTGIIAALSLIVFKAPETTFTKYQKSLSQLSLETIVFAIALGITEWFMQAMYYNSRAHHFKPGNEEGNKVWKHTRNIVLALFCILFIIGVVAASLFLNSLINVRN
jgi:ABC-type Fe3+ transport system permease subunit